MTLDKLKSMKINANDLFKAGKYTEALEAYKNIIQLAPEESEEAKTFIAQCQFNCGMAYKKLGNFGQAEEAFAAALKLDDAYQKAYFQRGECRRLQGKYQAALLDYQQAINLNPTNLDAKYGVFLCEQHLAARCNFFIADVKDGENGKFAILELAPGMQSGFEPWYKLTGEHITDVIERKRTELKLPPIIWQNQPGCDGEPDYQLSPDEVERYLWDTHVFERESLASQAFIVNGQALPSYQPGMLSFNDELFTEFGQQKLAQHRLFEKKDMCDLRPLTVVFEFPDTLSELDARLKELVVEEDPAKPNNFVLKIPDLERGEGIIFAANRDDLQAYLRFLAMARLENMGVIDNYAAQLKFEGYVRNKFPNDKVKQVAFFKPVKDKVVNFLRSSHAKQLLIEQYVAGKPVVDDNGHSYEATLRITFFVIRDKGVVRVEPISCHYHLAVGQRHDTDPYRANLILLGEQENARAVKVDDKTQARMFDLVSQRFPSYFESLFDLDFEQWDQQLFDLSDMGKFDVYINRALVFVDLGRFDLAELMLQRAQKHEDIKDMNLYIQACRGYIALRQGKFAEVLMHLSPWCAHSSKVCPRIAERACEWFAQANTLNKFGEITRLFPNNPYIQHQQLARDYEIYVAALTEHQWQAILELGLSPAHCWPKSKIHDWQQYAAQVKSRANELREQKSQSMPMKSDEVREKQVPVAGGANACAKFGFYAMASVGVAVAILASQECESDSYFSRLCL